ncbi:MAG: phosphate ABC transporter substrate-binding protein [Eubacteriales bacterium]
MKRTLTFLLSTMMLTAALSSCSSEDTEGSATPAAGVEVSDPATPNTGNEGNEGTEVAEDGVISMGGSTSVEEIVSAMMQVYMGENEGLSMTYSGTGSSTGVADVLADKIDVGLASRALKDSEMSEGAVAHVFAFDGIALIVNTDNGITDISSEDLAKIFTKEVTNWSELGGNDGQIVVVGRDAASGTRGAFEEILGVTDNTAYDSELDATGAVISTVAGNANAIGYVSLSAVSDQVTAINVDGVSPSEETIKDESYPIQRPFIFVTSSNIADPEMEAFVAWATSEAVAELVSSKGAVAPTAP